MSSWSSEDMVRAGCLHSIDTTHDAQQRAAEAIQKLQRAGKTRGPSDDQGKTVFDRLMFFNIQQSLFRYPTLGRTEATVPDLHPKVQGSARQCLQVPNYFRKNAADQPKKDLVLSGPKQSLVKWGHNVHILEGKRCQYMLFGLRLLFIHQPLCNCIHDGCRKVRGYSQIFIDIIRKEETKNACMYQIMGKLHDFKIYFARGKLHTKDFSPIKYFFY